jgi:hypothetical protein
MSDSPQILSLERIKAALTAEGRTMTDEQAQALADFIASLGGVGLARAAVELLADVQDAA